MKKLLAFLLCIGSDFLGLGMVNAQTQKPRLTLSIPATKGNIFFVEVDEVDEVVAVVDRKEAKMVVQQPRQTELASKPTATVTDEKVDEASLSLDQLYSQAEIFLGGKDPAYGVELLVQAANRGSLEAMELLATCLRHGTGCEKDLVKAFKWAYCAASRGSASAMLTVGSCLCHGNGCARNEKAGVAWYKRGAVRGDPGSMNNLGGCLMRGTGGVVDEEAGISWITVAAAAGCPWAMSNIGLYLLEGRYGYMVDPFRAVKLFKEAIKVERTCNIAFLYLGYCYQHGIGILKDSKKAKELYARAAELQGNASVEAWLAEQKKDRWLINRPNDDFCIEYGCDQKKPKRTSTRNDDVDIAYHNGW
jgi:TPR repeat protein